MIHKFPIYHRDRGIAEWFEYSDADIARMRAQGMSDAADEVEMREREYRWNPLSFFLPHGMPWRRQEKVLTIGKHEVVYPRSEYPKEWRHDGVGFINDWTNDVSMLIGPRKCGKSFGGAAKMGFYLCEPGDDWQCIQDHGVMVPEWEGPRIAVVASFNPQTLKEVWSAYREVFPREELGNYAPNYGDFPGEEGKQANLNFGDSRPKSLQLKKSRSVLHWLMYSQMQGTWENVRSDVMHADEQAPMEKIAAWEQGAKMTEKRRIFVTASGYTLPERPDTGASGYLKSDWWDGQKTGGRSIGRYCLSVNSTPDVFIPKASKDEAKERYEEHFHELTEYEQKRAIAVHYGGWQEGAGLVVPNFSRRVHILNPLWDDNKVPREWTKKRVVDYGTGNGVTAVGWFATGPKRWSVCYRVLYEFGLEIAEAAKMMISMSHNQQVRVGEIEDEVTGSMHPVFEEVFVGEEFTETVLDSRSMSQTQKGETLAAIFQRYGIECTPACGQNNAVQIPRLTDMLDRSPDWPHPEMVDDDGKPEWGCQLYFLDGRTDKGVAEVVTCERDEDDPTRIPRKSARHFIDVLKYFASSNPVYEGPAMDRRTRRREKEEAERELMAAGAKSGNYTGY